MHLTATLNKMVPSSEGPILVISGGNPNGFVLSVQNQDPLGTLVYKVQQSNDGGANWEDIEFPVADSDPASTFTAVAGAAHALKVTSTAPLIRMVGYGDVEVAISILAFRSTPYASASPASISI